MTKCFIIAEAGVNHNGSIDLAKKLIDVAYAAGADAVKFQTFQAEKLVTRAAPMADYQNRNTGSSESQFEMLKRLELSVEDHNVLVKYCGDVGIEFLSTPFDAESVPFLVDELKVSRLKLGSGELTNAQLLLAAARSGKPLILSTGMATLEEIEMALGVLAFGYTSFPGNPCLDNFKKAYASSEGHAAVLKQVALLQCTSEYPAPFEDVNLKVMDGLKQQFGVSVGFSDHTPGIAISIAAAARGASVIEKHFTLDRTLPGPDHRASLEPAELKAMVLSIREVELALGNDQKAPAASEMKNRKIARRSLVAACDIRRGDTFDLHNLTVKRPETGISAIQYWDWIGKVADRDYVKDEAIQS